MENNNIFTKVFCWLGIGLFLSFLTAYYVSTNTMLINTVFSRNYIILVILELVVAFVLALFITKLSKTLTTILYLAYCIITGFTLSSIFLVYEITSIGYVFLITSFIFFALALYGYKTNKDITKIGTILLFGLLGIVLITIINIFVGSSALNIIVTIISMLVFTCYIAYDIHLIKRKMYDMEEDKLAVYGAFQLYLDFINLFIDLLRLFGKAKD